MKQVKYDMRIKFLILLIVNLTATMQKTVESELLLLLMVSIFYITQGKFKFSLKGVGIYLSIMALTLFFGQFKNIILGVFVFTLIAIKKVFHIVFFASGILFGSQSGEILFALQYFKLPKNLVLMFAIVFRFFPSFSSELINSRNALKLRCNTSFSIRKKIHDFIYFSIIPLMRRAELVTDEISQVAVLRGIDNSNKRTSMFNSSLKYTDILLLLGFIMIFFYSVVAR